MTLLKVALSALFFYAGCSQAMAQEIVGRASVVDGDTIEVHGQRVRLHGIDAPESDQLCSKAGKSYRCGQQAALYLDKLVANKTIKCRQNDIDRYGRIVAECFVGDVNVNSSLVRAGWALAYRQYSTAYVSDEKAAQSGAIGIWAGDFVNPADYRRQPKPEEVLASNGCLIKGNINSKGQKIYHLQGTTAYGKTQIDTRKGERWFCTIDEAKAAGWRPALTR